MSPRRSLAARRDDVQAVAASLDRWMLPSVDLSRLEEVLTHPEAFGLTTASPVQRAVCRIADGLPLRELAKVRDVRDAVGDIAALPTTRPNEVYIVSGSRCGKTRTSAAVAVRATQTVDVSRLGPGDEARIPILSLDRDKAYACYLHLRETMHARPALRDLIVREGRNELDAPAIWIRSPSGRAIMVCVAAGKAAGNAVVSYFLAGVIFDEFCKMSGSSDAVVNFEDSRRNALGRLLPGAQLVAIGSPWAPHGPAYDAIREHWKRPTSKLVIVRARGRVMNPTWWTPERIASLPADVLRTEEEAEFRDHEEALYSIADVDAVTRAEPDVVAPAKGHSYEAAMDPATRSNAWTLVIATTRIVAGKPRKVVVLARQWQGSVGAPLSPDVVLSEIASVCRDYRVEHVRTDQFAADALRDIGARHGLYLVVTTWTTKNKLEAFESMRVKIADRAVELPPDPVVRGDLLGVRRRVTQAGLAIVLPHTGDGRHADYAPALAMLVGLHVDAPTADTPKPGTREAREAEARALEDAAVAELERDTKRPWWDPVR